MATVIKPPGKWKEGFSVFLAGSIEMGAAESWQQRFENLLSGNDVILFNPRRDDWDPSWGQGMADVKFREQVEWELDALSRADRIALYFDPATRAPVSLLEFGLYARTGKMTVCCPEGFWRKGNVDIVCRRYGVEQVSSLEALADRVLSVGLNEMNDDHDGSGMNSCGRNRVVPELSVTDFEKSLRFYGDMLGFNVRYRRADPSFAYLVHGNAHIMLEKIHDRAWITGELAFPFGRGVNFEIELGDISPVLMRLRAANIPLYRDQKETWYDTGETLSGQREFLVQDPDGYLLRFCQSLGEKIK